MTANKLPAPADELDQLANDACQGVRDYLELDHTPQVYHIVLYYVDPPTPTTVTAWHTARVHLRDVPIEIMVCSQDAAFMEIGSCTENSYLKMVQQVLERTNWYVVYYHPTTYVQAIPAAPPCASPTAWRFLVMNHTRQHIGVE